MDPDPASSSLSLSRSQINAENITLGEEDGTPTAAGIEEEEEALTVENLLIIPERDSSRIEAPGKETQEQQPTSPPPPRVGRSAGAARAMPATSRRARGTGDQRSPSERAEEALLRPPRPSQGEEKNPPAALCRRGIGSSSGGRVVAARPLEIPGETKKAPSPTGGHGEQAHRAPPLPQLLRSENRSLPTLVSTSSSPSSPPQSETPPPPLRALRDDDIPRRKALIPAGKSVEPVPNSLNVKNGGGKSARLPGEEGGGGESYFTAVRIAHISRRVPD